MSTNTPFRDRLAGALEKRLGVKGDVKLIARRINRNEDTIANWLNARTSARGEDIDALYRYFASQGDTTFLLDVFGEDLALIGEAERIQQQPTTSLADDYYWVSEDGAIGRAPRGLGAYVRETLRPGEVREDLVAYGVRDLGWIAITRAPTGRLELRLALPQVAPNALRRLDDWLVENAGFITEVTVVTHQSGLVVDRRFKTLSDARDALTRSLPMASPISSLSVALRAVRKPTSQIPDAGRRAVLDAWDGPHTELDTILSALRANGLQDQAAILEVRGDDIVARALGAELKIDPAANGRSVLSGGDAAYARMQHDHYLEVAKTGLPSFHDIEIAATFDHGAYDRLALPVTDSATGRQLIIAAIRVTVAPRNARLF